MQKFKLASVCQREKYNNLGHVQQMQLVVVLLFDQAITSVQKQKKIFVSLHAYVIMVLILHTRLSGSMNLEVSGPKNAKLSKINTKKAGGQKMLHEWPINRMFTENSNVHNIVDTLDGTRASEIVVLCGRNKAKKAR